MIARRAGLTVFVVVLSSCLLFANNAGRFKGESLRGLHGAFVTVHYSGKPHSEAGLTETQLASEVSLRLQIAGLKVLTEPEWKKTAGRPYLYVNIIDTGLLGKGQKAMGYVYTCTLDLMQETSLARNPRSIIDACTWSRGATIAVPSNDLGQVRVLVGDLASEFAAAVRAANLPRRETASYRSLEKLLFGSYIPLCAF